jgi:hypothetical protein
VTRRDPPHSEGGEKGEALVDERDPEIVAVLEGRDTIALDADLVQEPLPPERKEALWSRVRRLPVPARIKLALSGNKETRQILSRDSVKLVQACVLRNPRVTLEEALAFAKNRSIQGELLRIIADQREWIRNYSVRLAIVQNPKTPLQIALTLLSGVHERDMRLLAHSKNVSTVVQQQARRYLLRRESQPSTRGR